MCVFSSTIVVPYISRNPINNYNWCMRCLWFPNNLLGNPIPHLCCQSSSSDSAVWLMVVQITRLCYMLPGHCCKRWEALVMRQVFVCFPDAGKLMQEVGDELGARTCVGTGPATRHIRMNRGLQNHHQYPRHPFDLATSPCIYLSRLIGLNKSSLTSRRHPDSLHTIGCSAHQKTGNPFLLLLILRHWESETLTKWFYQKNLIYLLPVPGIVVCRAAWGFRLNILPESIHVDTLLFGMQSHRNNVILDNGPRMLFFMLFFF